MLSSRHGIAHILIASSVAAVGCGGEDATCFNGRECGTPELESDGTLPLAERLAGLDVDLMEGSRGPEVRAVHDYLTAYGYFSNDALSQRHAGWRPVVDEDPEDFDVYDAHTAAAVRELQGRSGLVPTGVVDKATLELLKVARCGVPEGLLAPDPSLKYDSYNGNGVWDNPGDITWRVVSANGMSGPGGVAITDGQLRTAAGAAFGVWQAVTNITFRQLTSGTANIQIYAANLGAGSGSVLAQAYQPDDYGNDLGGDIAISNGPIWSTNGTPAALEYDLRSVLVHEIGHSLGLMHSSVALASMLPNISDADLAPRSLEVDDKVAVSSLYDTFTQVPGSAHDIAVGGDGSDADTDPDVWIIGNTTGPQGFRVEKFDGSGFVQASGSGLRIAVTPDGRPWIVNDLGLVYERSTSTTSSGTWTQRAGCASDIGVGGTGGGGSVWVLGCTTIGVGGYHPYYWNGTAFVSDSNVSAAGVRIAVGSDGIPWLVVSNGSLFRRTTGDPATGTWEHVVAAAADVGIGKANYPWVLGASAVPNGHPIFVWDNQGPITGSSSVTQWMYRPGGATSISVGPNGEPWLSGADLSIHRTTR